MHFVGRVVGWLGGWSVGDPSHSEKNGRGAGNSRSSRLDIAAHRQTNHGICHSSSSRAAAIHSQIVSNIIGKHTATRMEFFPWQGAWWICCVPLLCHLVQRQNCYPTALQKSLSGIILVHGQRYYLIWSSEYPLPQITMSSSPFVTCNASQLKNISHTALCGKMSDEIRQTASIPQDDDPRLRVCD
jgi:hypothetical protein